MFKQRLIASIVAMTFSTSSMATVQTQMQTWFDSMGAYGNVTSAQMIQGQTSTTYMGGSMFMRTPIKNYSIGSINPPSIKAGCGGIDLFAGSASFMNMTQLTDMLRNIGNNMIGPAFMLTLKSLTPDLASLLEWAQDQASKANAMNINSCQMAEGIVTSLPWPALKDNKEEVTAKGTNSSTNSFTDSFQGWDAWKKSNADKQTARAAIKAVNPQAAKNMEPSNVVWTALSGSNVPVEIKELMMSMVGSFVVIPAGATGNAAGTSSLGKVVEPTGIKFSQFIGNPDAATQNIDVWSCGTDTTNCLTPTRSTTPAKSLSYEVRAVLLDASNNITNRSAQSFTGLQQAIITNSYFPIWRIANVAGMSGNNGIIATNYSELIAVELAYNWYREMVKELRKAMQLGLVSDSPEVKAESEHILNQLKHIESLAQLELNTQYQKGKTIVEMQRSIQWLHETTMRSLPVDMQNSLAVFNQ